MSTAPTIPCKQCGHVNEGERVYCHNCGTKLDRTVLPPPDPKTQESAQQARKRVRRMTSPMRGFFAGGLRSLLHMLLWSVVVAAAIQMARPPDRVPPMPKSDDLGDAPQLAMVLQQSIDARAPQRLGMSEELINKYLGSTVKPQPNGILGDSLRFERAFVRLEENVCRIIMAHSFLGFTVYVGSDYHLSIAKEGIAAENCGGCVGRLPVHPQLMKYSDLLFDKLWAALGREKRLMNAMRSIEVHKGQIVVLTKSS